LVNNKNNILEKRIYFLIAPPAAGKTTFYRKYLQLQIGPHHYISTDRIRKDLTGSEEFNEELEPKVWKRFKERFLWAILHQEKIVLDSTFTDPSRRKKYQKWAKEAGYFVFYVIFYQDFDTLIENNLKRDRYVPIKVIQKKYRESRLSDLRKECDQLCLRGVS